MKSPRDIPDRFTLNASSTTTQPKASGSAQDNQRRVTTLSGKEVLDKIPLTIYTQRAKRY